MSDEPIKPDASQLRLFLYQARDEDGALKLGSVGAQDEATARQILTLRGLRVVAIREEKEPTDPSNSGAVATGTRTSPARSWTLSHDATVDLIDSLSLDMQAQIPLSVSLEALEAETNSRHARELVRALNRALSEGVPFADAILKLTGNSSLAEVASLGEQQNQLPRVLRVWVQQERTDSRLRSQFFNSLIYPAVLVFCSLLVLVLLMIVVVPQMVGIFDSFDVQMPVMSRPLFWLGKWVQARPILIGSQLLGIVPAVLLLLMLKPIQQLVSTICLHLPVVRWPFVWTGYAHFARTLAALIRERIPLPDALAKAGAASWNQHLKRMSTQIASRLDSGTPIDLRKAGRTGFPTPVLLPFLNGVTSDEAAAELDEVATWYEQRARALTSILTEFTEPITVICMAAVVFWIICSLMLPLIKLLNDLS